MKSYGTAYVDSSLFDNNNYLYHNMNKGRSYDIINTAKMKDYVVGDGGLIQIRDNNGIARWVDSCYFRIEWAKEESLQAYTIPLNVTHKVWFTKGTPLETIEDLKKGIADGNVIIEKLNDKDKEPIQSIYWNDEDEIVIERTKKVDDINVTDL